MEDYRMEQLAEEIYVAVSREHRFGTDAFLLSDFAAVRPKDTLCDLGTGCGIIPLLRFRQKEQAPREAWGVDVQPQAVRQLEHSIAVSGLKGRLHAVCADLKELRGVLPGAAFTVVTCNPPYKAAGAGILSETDSQQIARHEVLCTMEDVCRAAARLLNFGGRLCVCQRPERLLDVLWEMRRASIEPKRIRMVQQRPEAAPWLALVEGRRGCRRGGLRVERPLLIERAESREFSDELYQIYGNFEEMRQAKERERAVQAQPENPGKE